MNSQVGDLLERWDERDRRYELRRAGLGFAKLMPEEIGSVRAYRLTEVDDLPAHERVIAWRHLQHWQPPTAAPRG